MSIEAITDESEYGLAIETESKEGSDGHRKFILLHHGEYCTPCTKNLRMKEFGIEKIAFQTYELAEEKLFDIDFEIVTESGSTDLLHFSDKIYPLIDNASMFSKIENMAIDVGAIGLAKLANEASVLGPRPRPVPPDKDSAYLRCMDACDNIELELFRLLCYVLCLRADDKPGS